jgi:minor pilin subunit PapF
MSRTLEWVLVLIMGGALALTANRSIAAGSQDVNVTIKGIITIPPCSVNDDSVIDVLFGINGQVDAANVNGEQAVISKVPVTCTYYQGSPHVRIIGTQMPGQALNVLKTNEFANLGIQLFQGNGTNTPMNIGGGSNGNGYEITAGLSAPGTAGGEFSFTSKLLQTDSAILSGQFSATAQMSISYD